MDVADVVAAAAIQAALYVTRQNDDACAGDDACEMAMAAAAVAS